MTKEDNSTFGDKLEDVAPLEPPTNSTQPEAIPDPSGEASATVNATVPPRHAVTCSPEAPRASEWVESPADALMGVPWAYKPFSLGLEGRLTPVATTAVRRTGTNNDPHDTVLDGFNSPGTIEVRGVSTRGHSHRFDGTVRQDTFALATSSEWIAAAVADGLGSEQFSHLGAEEAVSLATSSEIVQSLIEAESSQKLDLGFIASALHHTARSRNDGSVASDFRTTLTLAIVMPETNGSTHCLVAQIGDSPAWLLREGALLSVFPSPRDELASSAVRPLPDEHFARAERIELLPGDSLLLTSDGVGNLLEQVTPYRQAVIDILSHGTPTLPTLLTLIDTSVRSYDDDRTCVLLRRPSDA